MNMMVRANGTPGCFVRCCFGILWTNGDLRQVAVHERLKYLEKEIDKEIEKPCLSSGHAFVVMDSVKSLNYCLSKSKITPTYAWQLAKVSFKETIEGFFSRENTRALRSVSQR
jgi:hypothetical protein